MMRNLVTVHDALLVADLKRQPLWLLILYVALGGVCIVMAMHQVPQLEVALAAGGGFLVALGCEKLVTRRIRSTALGMALGQQANPSPRK